jgi:hypothetical protein
MELTPDKWQRAKALFDEALQKAASERASFLAAACPEADLRDEVEQLLRNHEQAGSFLSIGAVLFEMATGQHAFSGRTTGAILMRF